MRRPAAILILLLLTSCRLYDAAKRAAAATVVQSFVHLQAKAPLTQSAARPAAATPDHARCLIASTPPKFLGWDPQRTVELRRSVFPGNHFGQLYDGIVVEPRAQAGKELVRYFRAGDRHAIRVFQRRTFDLREKRRARVVVQCQKLLVSNS